MILVVDDVVVTPKTVGRSLGRTDHHIVSASEGVKVFTILQSNPQISPLKTGFIVSNLNEHELGVALRRSAKFTATPMLVMSAMIKAKEIFALLDADTRRFLAKLPAADRLVKKVVLTLIHSMLGRRQSARLALQLL